MTKISVGLVDDQPLVRTGFAMLINSQDDMETSWEASDGAEVPTQTHADIVLMDVQMPKVNGIEATRTLLRSDADTKVIMLTTFDDQDFVSGAIEAGASGFLLKDAQPEELLHAIRLVYAGQAVLAPKATARVLGMLKNQGVDKHVDVVFDCVGGETGRRAARAVKPDGVVVHYGLLSGRPLGEVGRQVEMFRLRDVVHACPRSELPALFEGVFDQLRAGRLRSRVAREVSLRGLPRALKEYRPGEGKLLVRVTD